VPLSSLYFLKVYGIRLIREERAMIISVTTFRIMGLIGTLSITTVSLMGLIGALGITPPSKRDSAYQYSE
jgi:hypothetical protein